ncbi:L-dopachrome tautomerase-related protein [Shewanella frigidimarina]|uniref:L-dopachrome tautomerase-related protein n=1 Tax=Shewanella frigidimarina TaxID=56812 RepID=UPI003D79DF6D|tara:strand:- start:8046 stop:9188 length:1143 start_codon:yes stop_codon:yes gene_type:complete
MMFKSLFESTTAMASRMNILPKIVLLSKTRVIASLVLLGSLFTSTVFAADYSVFRELDSLHPPGNVAVSSTGQVFMSNHHFYGVDSRIVELKKDGSIVDYPNTEFNQNLNPVLGVVIDEQGILWMLETASTDGVGRLIGWDTQQNRLYKMISLAAPVLPDNSFLNDLAVDRQHEAVYISDPAGGSNAALIVVDLTSGTARRVLDSSVYTRPENVDTVINGNTLSIGGQPIRIGVDSLTIDPNNEWVYFGALSGEKLYRVHTQYLLDAKLSANMLRSKVEFYANKPVSDGITIDNGGNIYVTDISNNAVGYIDTDRQYHILHQDSDKFSWSDGFSTTADGKLLVTVNKLHQSPAVNNQQDKSDGHYYIIQFDALTETTVGR